ncbi:MAG: methyltransferase domain-containing protein [Patescibacteria group bacterium]|nr:methyltransferase domain-containing protein [Patescibacteria group bacterium]
MDKQTQKNLLNLVKANYEEISGQFNQTRKKYLWPELIKLTEKIKTGDKILDVGCGNGRLLEAFKNKRIDYLGIDSSENLIEHAKKLHPKNKFIVGDILDLGKIPEINFDYVFSIALFHHLPGDDLRIAALRQLKNKVGEEGKIIIAVWNLWSQAKFRKLIFKFTLLKIIKKNLPAGRMDFGDILFDWKSPDGKAQSRRYYHAFTKMELRKIIKKAGLKIEKLYKDKYNYYAILKK